VNKRVAWAMGTTSWLQSQLINNPLISFTITQNSQENSHKYYLPFMFQCLAITTNIV